MLLLFLNRKKIRHEGKTGTLADEVHWFLTISLLSYSLLFDSRTTVETNEFDWVGLGWVWGLD